MDALDIAFNTLKKSVGVIPSESVSKKSQSQLNRERKQKMRQAKKEKEAGIPPLPGTGFRRIKEDGTMGRVPPGEDPKNYAAYKPMHPDSPEFPLDAITDISEGRVARRKKGPYSGGDTDIFEFVDGEWKPTEAEMEPMGHLWEPTGRRRITGVERRRDEKAKKEKRLESDRHQAGMAAIQPLIDAHPSTPPQPLLPAPSVPKEKETAPSRFSNWIRKPLDAAYQRLLNRPPKEEEPEQVTAE